MLKTRTFVWNVPSKRKKRLSEDLKTNTIRVGRINFKAWTFEYNGLLL